MSSPRLLVFAGSSRTGSLNTRLARAAAAVAESMGATVTLVSLADFEMPLYDGDLEAEHGIPEGVQRWKRALIEHDGFIVASPEYNGSLSPLLKNAIDWASRREGDEPRLVAFQGKVVGLLAASPGGLGGLRALPHVRTILSGIGAHVVPRQFALGGAHQAFADDGSLADEGKAAQMAGVVEQVVQTARALNG